MRELMNKDLAIEVGSVVEHKSDNRQMIVIDFAQSRVHANPEVKDKNLPICRFFQEKTETYISQEFLFAELIVVE